VLAEPSLFWPILFLNLWLLGYHHVVSTYTRLCFDGQSFSESKFLIFGLLPIVAIVTLLIAKFVGLWAIFSIYFYWQLFHYARQSWGISRAYRGKDRHAHYEDGWVDKAIFYSVPTLGMLHRSYQNPDKFLGGDMVFFAVPFEIFFAAVMITSALLLYWVYRRVQAWRRGELASAHTLYLISHFVIFAIGYLLIEDITVGWLAINIWHNAQYILFVWLFNSNRFKGGFDPKKRFLSYISQPNRLPLYLGVCVAITAVYYVAVLGSLERFFVIGVTSSVVIYQIVNFHHYIVDSLIWKVRKPAIRKNIGITS